MKLNLFKKKKVVPPVSWGTLTIGKFQKIRDIEARYSGDTESDSQYYEILAVLEDCSVDTILNLPISLVTEMMASLRFLYTQPKHVLVKPVYQLGDTRYKIAHNLTTAQWIDFQNLREDYVSHLAEFLSVFLVPVGFEYNVGYESEKTVAGISRYLTVEEGLAIADFFSTAAVLSLRRGLRLSLIHI